MIDIDASFFRELLNVSRAQWVREIPSDAHQNDRWWKMRALETHRHRLVPSSMIVAGGGRSYLKSTAYGNCDRADFSVLGLFCGAVCKRMGATI